MGCVRLREDKSNSGVIGKKPRNYRLVLVCVEETPGLMQGILWELQNQEHCNVETPHFPTTVLSIMED